MACLRRHVKLSKRRLKILKFEGVLKALFNSRLKLLEPDFMCESHPSSNSRRYQFVLYDTVRLAYVGCAWLKRIQFTFNLPNSLNCKWWSMEVLAACAVSKACPVSAVCVSVSRGFSFSEFPQHLVSFQRCLPLQHGLTLHLHIHSLDLEKSTMFNGSPLEPTSDFGGALHVQQARPWADVICTVIGPGRSVKSVLKSAMLMSLQTWPRELPLAPASVFCRFALSKGLVIPSAYQEPPWRKSLRYTDAVHNFHPVRKCGHNFGLWISVFWICTSTGTPEIRASEQSQRKMLGSVRLWWQFMKDLSLHPQSTMFHLSDLQDIAETWLRSQRAEGGDPGASVKHDCKPVNQIITYHNIHNWKKKL